MTRNARQAIAEWQDDALGSHYLDRVSETTGLSIDDHPAAVAAMVVSLARTDGYDI